MGDVGEGMAVVVGEVVLVKRLRFGVTFPKAKAQRGQADSESKTRVSAHKPAVLGHRFKMSSGVRVHSPTPTPPSMKKSRGKRRSQRNGKSGDREGVGRGASNVVVNPALEADDAEEVRDKVEGDGRALEYDVFEDALSSEKLYR